MSPYPALSHHPDYLYMCMECSAGMTAWDDCCYLYMPVRSCLLQKTWTTCKLKVQARLHVDTCRQLQQWCDAHLFIHSFLAVLPMGQAQTVQSASLLNLLFWQQKRCKAHTPPDVLFALCSGCTVPVCQLCFCCTIDRIFAITAHVTVYLHVPGLRKVILGTSQGV